MILPFPSISAEGKFRNGSKIPQPNYCRNKCSDRHCKLSSVYPRQNRFIHQICKNGFSIFVFESASIRVTINGVYDNSQNDELPKHLREANKVNKIDHLDLLGWEESLRVLSETIEREILSRTLDSIAHLHDVKTISGMINAVAEDIIDEAPGSTFEIKVTNSDPKMKSLLHGLNLLGEHLELLDIIANPQRIDLGVKKLASPYKLFHKIARTFDFMADKRHVEIELYGTSHKQIQAYNTIHLIPVILLDNAIKYSKEGNVITVNMNEDDQAINVAVTSFGPIVPKEERSRIFEKYFRGNNVIDTSSKGGGIGLYLAREIMRAHNGTIEYTVSEYEIEVGGKQCGYNTFMISFRVR